MVYKDVLINVNLDPVRKYSIKNCKHVISYFTYILYEYIHDH